MPHFHGDEPRFPWCISTDYSPLWPGADKEHILRNQGLDRCTSFSQCKNHKTTQGSSSGDNEVWKSHPRAQEGQEVGENAEGGALGTGLEILSERRGIWVAVDMLGINGVLCKPAEQSKTPRQPAYLDHSFSSLGFWSKI